MNFDSYKSNFESEQLAKIQQLQEKNAMLDFEHSMLRNEKTQNEKLLKDTTDKLNLASQKYQTEMALLKQ